MSNCRTSIKTPTGVFTFFDKIVTHCEAKLQCSNIGQILAPLTNAEDIKALRSIVDEDCEFHDGFFEYHIGLDVRVSDGVQTRLFTNNVAWNETEHGKLYKWVGSETRDINSARFSDSFTNSLYIIKESKYNRKKRFICLKPRGSKAPSCPDRLSSEKAVESSSLFAFGAVMFVVVGSIFVLLARKRRIESEELVELRNENKLLKEEIEGYKVYRASENL